MSPELLCMGCMAESGGEPFCRYCGRAANEPAASLLHLPPRTVLHNQYVLGRALGHGGFGITYLAWDLNLARRLAVKEYLPGGMGVRGTGSLEVTPYSGQMDAFRWGLEKFLEEARVLARFQNQPGIVAVLNFFRENGTAYLVMEYLNGITMQEYLNRGNGKIEPAVALRIMMPVIDALREVHKMDVLHRDISPDNIYLCDSGQVKVLDFGAARYALSQQSRSLSIILKEGYAPEEQYRTKGKQGPWTDVYATAATLYRAITGVIPPPALDRKESDELIAPSALGVSIDAQFEQALLRGMAVRAADRFASMEEFQAAIANGADLAGSQVALRRSFAEGNREPIPRSLPSGETRPMRAESAGETRPMKVAPAGETRPLGLVAGGETRPLVRSREIGPIPPREQDVRRDPNVPGDLNVRPIVTEPVWKRIPKWMLATSAVVLAMILFLIFGHQKGAGAAPVIQSFRAEKNGIQPGGSAVLIWNVEGKADVTLDPGGKTMPRAGKYEVRPTHTETYTLSARNASGIDAQQVTVQVAAGGASHEPDPAPSPKHGTSDAKSHVPSPTSPSIQPTPQIERFVAEPGSIRSGESATLRWSVADATQVFLSPGFGRVLSQGAVEVSPSSSQTFLLSAVKEGMPTASSSVTVRVLPPEAGPAQIAKGPGPEIVTFQARPSSVTSGQPVTLSWSVRGASGVTIQPELGPVETSGMRTEYPMSTTNFTLTASGAGHDPVQATATVRVMQPENRVTDGQQRPQGSTDNAATALRNQRPLRLNVLHDHGGAIGGTAGAIGGVLSRLGRRNTVPGNNESCSGTISIQNSTISFNGNPTHSFSVPLSSVSEVQTNRIPLQGREAFHIRLNDGENYNFVPQGANANEAVAQIRKLLR